MTPLNPIDREALRARARSARPFPNVRIDDFLEESFAEEVNAAFPSFEGATRVGRIFRSVNERGKVQVTDARTFAEPLARLNRALAAPEFLDLLSYAFDIPDLVGDAELVGGGIHQTGPRGHLDVHVDFNFIKGRGLYRRLNILVYFNKDWQPEWGGDVELWDSEVRNCVHSFGPVFNRCVIFETSAVSFHGVTAVRCPEGRVRQSFAAYYYTAEAPPHWSDQEQDTVFRARPDERFKGAVLMPMERARWRLREALRGARTLVKRGIPAGTRPRRQG
jgi:Rps23 Pro-64 3,4-dihydroxylase Tpa1-like proline 4-hydroxylase